METLDYGNTSDNIYNSIKHTGNTLTILPLDNDIISTQWYKYNRDLNYQWKNPQELVNTLWFIDDGSTSWCTCIYDFPMVVFLHPSMLQYLKQTFMQYDRPLSKKYKTCSVFLLFDNERKFKNDRRC